MSQWIKLTPNIEVVESLYIEYARLLLQVRK